MLPLLVREWEIESHFTVSHAPKILECFARRRGEKISIFLVNRKNTLIYSAAMSSPEKIGEAVTYFQFPMPLVLLRQYIPFVTRASILALLRSSRRAQSFKNLENHLKYHRNRKK